MPASGKWRERLSGQAALRHLLPLLLPRDGTAPTPARIEGLGQPHWVDTAHRRGLAPAFYVFLRQRDCWPLLSALAQDKLEAAYRENLAQCMVREQVLGTVLKLLEGMGRWPVLLKGLALAAELYPEPAARLAGDIDVLVPWSWKAEVNHRLCQAGFRLLTQPSGQPARSRSVLRHAARVLGLRPAHITPDADEGEAVFLTRMGGQDIMIELHYHLINLRAGGGKAEVFHSRDDAAPPVRTLHLPAGEVTVLDHAAAFLHALRHIALHHRLIGFRWHHDLALMLTAWQPFLVPEEIREQCRQSNSTKILDVELAVLRELFGPAVFGKAGQDRWGSASLPWEYPLYRHVATGGKRTPLRELVRTLLAPTLRQQLQTLT